MTKKYDTLVLIGRFQPVHNAHAAMIARATKLAKQLIIIVGSANQPRTYKNPWTSHERRLMLQYVCNTIPDTECAVRFEENIDTIYNNAAWASRVQAIVAKHTIPGENIAIIGHKKDDTRYYLDMFPQWGYEDVESVEPLNATNVRELYFRRDANINFLANVIPKPVCAFLDTWKNSSEHEQIIREREFAEVYKRQFSGLQYEPVFVTVDVVYV